MSNTPESLGERGHENEPVSRAELDAMQRRIVDALTNANRAQMAELTRKISQLEARPNSQPTPVTRNEPRPTPQENQPVHQDHHDGGHSDTEKDSRHKTTSLQAFGNTAVAGTAVAGLGVLGSQAPTTLSKIPFLGETASMIQRAYSAAANYFVPSNGSMLTMYLYQPAAVVAASLGGLWILGKINELATMKKEHRPKMTQPFKTIWNGVRAPYDMIIKPTEKAWKPTRWGLGGAVAGGTLAVMGGAYILPTALVGYGLMNYLKNKGLMETKKASSSGGNAHH